VTRLNIGCGVKRREDAVNLDVRALEEIHCICRPAAGVHITVPHFSSANAFTVGTHRHWFGWNSFAPYTTEYERC